jgi:hypothetical protein
MEDVKMKNLVVICIVFFSPNLFGASIAELQAISDTAIQECRGAKFGGSSSLIDVSVNGELNTVVLKKLVDLGGEGKFKFTKEEWNGFRAMTNITHDKYVECVSNAKEFFSKHLEKNELDQKESNDCIAKLKCDSSSHNSMRICLDAVKDVASEKDWPESKKERAEMKCFENMGISVNKCYPQGNVKLARSQCEAITGTTLKDY